MPDKKVSITAMVIFFAIVLFPMVLYMLFVVGCSEEEIYFKNNATENYPTEDQNFYKESQEQEKPIFYILEEDNSIIESGYKYDIDSPNIIVDNDTGVEYLYIWNDNSRYGGGAAITLRYNQDGTPKINEKWLEDNSMNGTAINSEEETNLEN